MNSFYAVAANGVNAVNTFGNRVYFMGVKITGLVTYSPSTILLTSINMEDCMMRECVLMPKNSYWSLLNTEANGVNTCPTFT